MKKIGSLLLAITLILSVLRISIPSYAEVPTEDNSDFALSVGIFDIENPPKGEDFVTRAELAKMYCRILVGDDEMTSTLDNNPRYSDVESDLLGVVDVVSKLGIMNGYEGVFNPNSVVTHAQLVKTMVAFLGYEPAAILKGGYPAGYYAVATELELNKNFIKDMNSPVTYNDVSDMFYNAIGADVMEHKTWQDEKYVVKEEKNYLNLYLDIFYTEGIITANNITNIYGGDTTLYNHIRLNDIVLYLEESAKDIVDFIGHKVGVYYKKAGSDSYKICYWEDITDDIEIFGDGEILGFKNYVLTYSPDGIKEKNLKLSRDVSVIYNGTLLKSYSDSLIDNFSKGRKDGTITVIENSGDSKGDVIIIEEPRSMVVKSIRDGVIYSSFGAGAIIDLDKFPFEKKAILNVKGDPLDKSDISVGDIITYYMDAEGNYTKIYVTIDVGEGIVEEIGLSANSVSEYLVINGERYACTKKLSTREEFRKLKIGDYVAIYFNSDRKISDIEIRENPGYDIDEICLLTSAKKGVGLDDTYKIRVYSKKGDFETYDLPDKIKFNGNWKKSKEALALLGYTLNTDVTRQIIKLRTDKDGVVKEIISALDSSDDSIGLYEMEGFDGLTAQSYLTDIRTFGLKAYLSSDTPVFVVPDEAERYYDDLYGMETVSQAFTNNGSYTFKAYSTKIGDPSIKAVVYEKDVASVTPGSTYNYMIIEKISNVLDTESGGGKLVIKGYARGGSASTLSEFIIAENYDMKIGPGGSVPQSGDVIRYALNSKGEIYNADLVLDISERKLFNMPNPSSSSIQVSTGRYAFGKVVKKYANHFTMEITDIDGNITYESYPISSLTSASATYNEITKMLSPTTSDGIFDEETFGPDASYVFTFFRNDYWIGGAVYDLK
ncbi:MAG: S-layer homology domain-containing protein [Clostridia bacterium]|nr:S-layer homology domain-containing protein [Clostridia bacterium]